MKGRNCSCPLPPSTFASSSSCFSSSSSPLGLRSAFAWAALILFLSLSCFFGAAESALFYASPGQLSSFTSIHRQPPQQHWKQSLKDELTCHTLAHHQVECNGTKYEPVRQHDTTGSSRFYVDLSVSIGLVAFAGLMSGLTMGLMSIDRMGLKILKNGGGTAREQKYAKRIYPLVKRHHLLLVTLLIANAAAMEALPIFLDRLVGPIYAILISITAILIAGEIIPQAVCTRWGLAIGAYLSWLVWVLIVLLGVVSYPISLLLDYLLGSQGTFYRRKELKQLVHLHGEEYHDDEEDIERNTTQEHGEEEKLCQDEVNIIKGALDMTTKSVTVPMTPIQKVWMLSDDARLDDATMDAILEAGHSRIPIYRGKDRGNIIGMLLVKSLIKVDPKAAVPIKSMDIHRLPIVDANMQLYPMLHFFQSGRSHMALVVDPEDHITVIGIITLEDIIEELIQEEIQDETDVFLDVAREIRVATAWQNLIRKKDLELRRGSVNSTSSSAASSAILPRRKGTVLRSTSATAWSSSNNLRQVKRMIEEEEQQTAGQEEHAAEDRGEDVRHGETTGEEDHVPGEESMPLIGGKKKGKLPKYL